MSTYTRLRRTVLGTCVALLGVAAFAGAASAGNYVVLYKQQAVPADAARMIEQAGGTLVQAYDEIGVAIASSDSAGFREALLAADSKVENASATEAYAFQLHDGGDFADASGPPEGDLPNAPATDADTFSGLQWDMRQIRAPEAHAVTGGSPAVVVGDIDTGLDWHHPDLAANVDFSRSVSCVGGVPNQDPAAWDDDNGHGTHTAGTIAAAANGFGVVGVAPNVKVAGIKAGNAAGYFFPEAVICSFVWAGTHGIDVTNNSYFADPWLYNCRNDPTQRAIWKAEQRAIRFAMQQGVTVVAAQGNENDDLAHPTIDTTSPDDSTPETREVTNACVVIPVEIPGVVGVTADGNLQQKSYYSSYGVGVAQLVAPGGDAVFQRTAEAANGQVLSTWPFAGRGVLTDPAGGPGAFYRYLQGTSMASPHVAGVAALVVSRFGSTNNSGNGKMRPERVVSYMQQTAEELPCPPNPFDPGGIPSLVATCQGGPGYNGFYGHGEVDALAAVLHDAG